MSNAIYITEVSPRDGLQNEPSIIATAEKVRLVQLLDSTGVSEIEVSSFVSPKWVPQLGDAAEVFAQIAATKPAGMIYSALAPNEKGMQGLLRANAAAGPVRLIDRVTVFTAASESFAQRNTNATIAETFERFRPVFAMARESGITIRAYISTVIRCPFEGDIAPGAVADVAAKLLAMGVDDIDLGDTIGGATPANTRQMLDAVIAVVGRENVPKLTLHLHDTYGRAAECVPVALECGLRSFDGAAGGLGGCPYASTPQRRAPGNIATDALVRAIHAAGFKTSVDLDKLAAAAEFARGMVACRTA